MHSEGRPADGALDFSGFSSAQLRDLEYTIDRQAYPLNYHNLKLELQRREQETGTPPRAQWPAEFTEHAGLRGWLETKARGLALYGAGYANSVSTQAWAVFAARTEMAAVSLRQSASHGRSTPLWYWVSINIGLDQSLTPDQLRVIFDQGYARFPCYLPLYRAMLRVLMPRWGGSYQKVDEFINAIYAKTWPSQGTRMYTQLYWAYGLMEGDDVNIFTDAQAEWSFMKPGFKQLLARYPRSDYVLNAYADFACRAGDKAQYEALRPELAKRFSASAWTKKFTLAACDS